MRFCFFVLEKSTCAVLVLSSGLGTSPIGLRYPNPEGVSPNLLRAVPPRTVSLRPRGRPNAILSLGPALDRPRGIMVY